MKIKDIFESSTTSGSVAPVSKAMNGGTQKRNEVGKGVYSTKKIGNLMTGKQTSKKFANSVKESKVAEDEIAENDLIVGPDKKNSRRKTGLHGRNENVHKRDIDVMNTVLVNGESILALLQQLPQGQGIEEWAKSAIAKANNLLTSVNSSLSEKLAPREGKKVDRMVKYVAKSEKGLGKSKKEADNIAWATANKRGMLNNKNKKKGK